jgi:glycosyltransferase involved in cell wall biosynthesis
MKVGVVITVFKRPERTVKAIATVKKQTYKDIQIIVVDGSNSPEIQKVVEEEKCIYLPVEPEYVKASFWVGIQHQRNIGCKYAKQIGCDFVAMLDDDDEWEATKIEKQVNAVNPLMRRQIGIILCYNRDVEDFGEYLETPKSQPTYEDLLKSFNLSPTSTFFINLDILEEVGWWNESLRGMHEYEIALKISRKGYLIITVQEVLMHRYRSFNQESYYYFIKIAEVMDFWHNYGKDIIPYLGFSGFYHNAIKTLGLFFIYLFGYIFKGKVWKVIYPLKQMYDQGVVIN